MMQSNDSDILVPPRTTKVIEESATERTSQHVIINQHNMHSLAIFKNSKAKKCFHNLFGKYCTFDAKNAKMHKRVTHLNFIKLCVDYGIIPKLISRTSVSKIFTSVLNDHDDETIVNSADEDLFTLLLIKIAEAMICPLLIDVDMMPLLSLIHI